MASNPLIATNFGIKMLNGKGERIEIAGERVNEVHTLPSSIT
jgi:hypothetical protein